MNSSLQLIGLSLQIYHEKSATVLANQTRPHTVFLTKEKLNWGFYITL